MSDIASLIGGDQFDPDQYDTSDSFDPMPPGEYPVFIEKAEVKDTKAGDGKYINLQVSVTGDQFNNRKVFAKINIVNKNPQAVQIGLRELAQLTKAVGLPTVKDSSELVDKSLIVRLKVKDGQNEIGAYKPLEGSSPSSTRPTATQPFTQPSTPTEAKKMPWQK